jgi:hypothetical protein
MEAKKDLRAEEPLNDKLGDKTAKLSWSILSYQ